jgi:uncharacterized protein involved in exopolysaccharide biosynthesis/Mrp family chromosome partitioning ATPase
MQDQDTFDRAKFRDSLTILFKHKKKILFTFIVIFIFSLVAKIVLPTVIPVKYEASSILMIKAGREFMRITETGEKVPTANLNAVLPTELALLTGHQLALDVVKKVRPEILYPDISKTGLKGEELVKQATLAFSADLQAKPVPGTSMIRLVYLNRNRDVALAAVKELVERFKERHLQVFSTSSIVYIEEQAERYGEKLKESESKLSAFKKTYGITSPDDQKSALLASRTSLESSLLTVSGEIKEMERKLSLTRGSEWALEDSPEVKAQILALEQKERDMLAKYKENTPMIKDLRRMIQEIKQPTQKYKENLRQAEVNKIQRELDRLKIKEDFTRKQLSGVLGALQSIDARATDFQRLKNEMARNESTYQSYLRKLEEVRIQEDLDRRKMVSIDMIEEPWVKRQGGKKQKIGTFILPLGIVGGIIAAIGMAFLLEFMTSTMTTSLNAENRLAMPVMVGIGMKRKRTDQENTAEVPGGYAAQSLPANLGPGASNNGVDMEREMIDLYQTITATLPEIEHRAVLFVGSRSNEGTSTIARQLANVVSMRMEKTVLLIDLDRSRPDLHVYPNLKPEIDSQDTLPVGGKIEQSFSRIEETSLYIMPLFWKTMITPKTIDYTKSASFWNSFKDQFDLIIVDSPPATQFPDGPAIVSKVDGVILVVEAEKTRWQVALSVKEKTLRSGGNILGIVFNKRRFYIPEIIYKYL